MSPASRSNSCSATSSSGFGTGDPILGAILLFVVLSLLYTYVGGVKAVIWTDAVQFGLFLLGGVFALCYIPSLVDGGMGAVFSKAAAAGKLHWLNATPPPGVSLTKFLLGTPFNIWMGVIGGTVLVLVLPRRRTVDRAAGAGLQDPSPMAARRWS